MKNEHQEIINRITNYLNEPNADHLRFGQALVNLNIIPELPIYSEKKILIGVKPKDIYNDSDALILSRLR